METVTPWLLTMSAAVGMVSLRIVFVLVLGYVGIRFVRLGLQQLERVMIVRARPRTGSPGRLKNGLRP